LPRTAALFEVAAAVELVFLALLVVSATRVLLAAAASAATFAVVAAARLELPYTDRQ
jgi:hypothetical protein